MGLRCSLLGHDFADAELDRDREERGDEVVITIREVKTCRRCGTEQVLSENTEVRPVESIEEVQDDAEAGAVNATPDTNAGARDTGTEDAGEFAADTGAEPDAAFIDAGDASGGAPVETAEGETFDAAEAADPARDAESDDGVILDESDESDNTESRHAGEWPEAEDTRMNERDVPAEAGPEVSVAADESEDAEILDGDAEPAADEPEAAPEPDASAGEAPAAAASETADESASNWPDPEGEDEGFDAEPGGERTDVEFSGIAPEGKQSPDETTPSESPSLAVDSETAFVCPECGFSKPADRASLRAGDICPECKKGYLREE